MHTLRQVRQMQKLLKEMGVTVTVRTENGADISGACGQLSVQMNGSIKAKANDLPVRSAVLPERWLPDYCRPVWKSEAFRDMP